MAIMKLNQDEVVEASIAPEYGFGDAEHQGALATVPPNSRLHYTVELLSMQKVRGCGA